MKVAGFSTGVSSAVAVKLVVDSLDEIIYTHIEDQHPDTIRFIDDCEKWFDKPVERIQSPYKSVEAALLGAGGKGYVNGPKGAACTRILKRRVRKEWELGQSEKLKYVWGMDIEETDRTEGLRRSMPEQEHVFPLIDRNITKEEAHRILRANGIKRPAMYDLGYQNNNCIGCVKGGMGYWNKIRQDFPDVFDRMAKMERELDAALLKRHDKDGARHRMFLDELDPNDGDHLTEAPITCGIMCEIESQQL